MLAFVPEDLPAYSVVSEISAMTDCASSMLKNGLQAFVTNDATAARKVIQRELEINKLYSRVFHTLLRLIVSKPAMATAHASSYSSQSTSKGLETILPTFVS